MKVHITIVSENNSSHYIEIENNPSNDELVYVIINGSSVSIPIEELKHALRKISIK